jgi:hypothetical protein
VLPAAGGDAGLGTNAIALFALTTGLALLLVLAFLGRRRASRVRRTRRAGDVA